MKKKRKKTVNEAYKRKSNVGGWVLFFVVVGVLVWYVRMRPGGEAIEAQRDPRTALQQYARIAYKVAHGETGGEAFFPKGVAELPAVYDRIAELLRSQYLLWYRSGSEKPPEEFREIRVEVSASDLDVQTIRGYYPGK